MIMNKYSQSLIIYTIFIVSASMIHQFIPSKRFAYGTLVVSILCVVLSMALVILMIIKGYNGFDSNLYIQLGTCSLKFDSTKYTTDNTVLHMKISFISAILSFILSLTITIFLIIWIRRVSEGQIPNDCIQYKNKIILYILSNLLVMSAIMPFAYYLIYFKNQTQSCSNTSPIDTTIVGVLAGIGALLLILALILWIMFFYLIQVSPQSSEKYKQINTLPTQNDVQKPQQKIKITQLPRQNIKPQKQTERQPQVKKQSYYQPKQQNKKFQQTQQNLYDSPSKRPFSRVYPKNQEKQPQYIRNNIDQPKNSQMNSRYNNNNKQQQIEKYPYNQSNPNKYPTKQYQQQKKKQPIYLQPKRNEQKSQSKSPKKQGHLVYYKQRKQPLRQQYQNLRKQQEKYFYNRRQGSILPSSGLKQRQYKNSQYFQSSGSPPIKSISPSKSGQRQGVLLNYIRGKYGN